MQVQNRLKRCNWGDLRGFRQWGLVLTTLLLLGLCVPYPIVAQDTVEDEVAAQRKKAEELLDTASAQLDRQQYQAGQKTLDRCDAYRDKLTSSQEKRFNKYSQEAQAGTSAQTNADAAIRAGTQHLSADRLVQAQEQFQAAYKLKKYLPAPQRKKIEDQLKVIKAKQKIQKKDIVTLFKKSKSDYKAGRLAEAKKGFAQIQQSGIKLGFFDTGDFTSTAGYLKKIAGKREKQAKAERKRQQELIKKQEEERERQQEILRKQQEEAEKTEVKPTPKVIEPTPQKVTTEEELTQIVAPTPSVTTPTKQEPKVKVEPTPTAVKKKKKFDPFGFLKKKKKPEKSPETLNLINQKMALANQAWTRGNYAQAKQLFMQVGSGVSTGEERSGGRRIYFGASSIVIP